MRAILRLVDLDRTPEALHLDPATRPSSPLSHGSLPITPALAAIGDAFIVLWASGGELRATCFTCAAGPSIPTLISRGRIVCQVVLLVTSLASSHCSILSAEQAGTGSFRTLGILVSQITEHQQTTARGIGMSIARSSQERGMFTLGWFSVLLRGAR